MPSTKGDEPNPALTPPIALLNLITGKWIAQALYVAAKLGIADLLKDGAKQCDELARANQVDARSLYRVMRALASVSVFVEVSDRCFGLTPMAECLRSDVPGSLRSLATMGGEGLFWRPWGDILQSVKTGEPAFDRTFGMGLFEALRQNPGVADIFNEAMTGWSAQSALAVTSAYDFSAVHTLVDVGGGHGLLSAAILAANPRMRAVLFDAPAVINGAKEKIQAAGLSDRCKAVEGDFFAAVPGGGDAYILKHIIHDWDDERAVTILTNCLHAMGKNGKLLVVEMVIPPGNDPFLGKLLDLEMLVIAGGHERTAAEYSELYRSSGFHLTKLISTQSPVSIIEGRPE